MSELCDDESGSEERNDELDVEHGPTLSDEEDFDELVDAFETSYNFRFEEPSEYSAAFVPTDRI